MENSQAVEARMLDATGWLAQILGTGNTVAPCTPGELAQSVEAHCATRIDAIRLLQQEITSLRSIHNAFLPQVARLPAELLCEIFFYLVRTGSRPPSRRSDLLNAAATCKRWRAIACDEPRLWSFILLNNLALTKVSVVRSRSRPLTVFLRDTPCGKIYTTVEVLKPHAHRITSVEVTHSKREVIAEFFQCMNVAAPILERLRINDCQETLHGGSAISSLFTRQTPSLRYLHLEQTVLTPSSIVTTELTELQVHHSLLSLLGILNMLEKCPKLQKLSVYFRHFRRNVAQPAAGRVVDLLSLRELCVSTDQGLLSHLSLPSTAILRVNLITTEGPLFNIPLFRRLTNIPCVRDLRRLEIVWDDRTRTVIFRASRYPEQHAVPDVEVVLALEDEQLPDRVFPMIISHFVVSQVEVCVFRPGVHTALDLNTWMSMLLELRSVATLRLVDPSAQTAADLLAALDMHRDTNHATDPRPDPGRFVVCSGLETLELFDLAWAQNVTTSLEKMIETRQWHLSALREVHVFGARGASEQVAAVVRGDLPQIQVLYDSA